MSNDVVGLFTATLAGPMRRLCLVGLSLVLSACAPCPEPSTVPPVEATTPAAEGSPVADEPRTIVFVRHAEKASDGTQDPPLTQEGEARAQCLVTMLRSFGTTHVFATEFQRTQATIEPLAEAMGLSVEVISAGDAHGWREALESLPAGARAVVAGHSNTIPAMVEALGAEAGELDDDGNIPHAEYDRMVVMVRGSGTASTSVFEYCASTATNTVSAGAD